jgi:hypothetical protein
MLMLGVGVIIDNGRIRYLHGEDLRITPVGRWTRVKIQLRREKQGLRDM